MAPRSTAQRISDAREKLDKDEDIWVASASPEGRPYLVPLSFSWDGEYITVATPNTSRTARNLRASGWTRMALGPTRDVVILEGPTTEQALDADQELAEFHAERSFDARDEPQEYIFIRMKVETAQAYRTSEELRGRVIMRNGEWLT